MSSPLRRLGTWFSEAHGLVLQSEVFHGDITARMARVSLTAKVANVDDLVCASSVSGRDIRRTVWLYLGFNLSYRDVEIRSPSAVWMSPTNRGTVAIEIRAVVRP